MLVFNCKCCHRKGTSIPVYGKGSSQNSPACLVLGPEHSWDHQDFDTKRVWRRRNPFSGSWTLGLGSYTFKRLGNLLWLGVVELRDPNRVWESTLAPSRLVWVGLVFGSSNGAIGLKLAGLCFLRPSGKTCFRSGPESSDPRQEQLKHLSELWWTRASWKSRWCLKSNTSL